MHYDTKQVIVVRRCYPDGNGGTKRIRVGKLMAQVAHASLAVFLDRHIVGVDSVVQAAVYPYNKGPKAILVIPLTEDMDTWVNGSFAKIILYVETEEDLLKVHQAALDQDLPCSLITDAGNTEFHGIPTNTTVAIGPAKSVDIDKITGPNGIVSTKLA